MIETRIKSAIRDVPDFPLKGVLFKDLTPVLKDTKLCQEITEEFAKRLRGTGLDAIAGIESRGFLFGLMLAARLGLPFLLIRKKGKLPYKPITINYQLEYGSSQLEMQGGDVHPGWKVLIHDDVLATGGTASAAAKLVLSQEGQIAGFLFLMELKFLTGREKIQELSQNIISLASY